MATLDDFKSETQLTPTAATMASTSATEKKFIGMATVTNTSTSNVQVTVWRMLTTTTAFTEGSGGNWLWRKTVPAGQTEYIDKIMGHVLGNSMRISALADTDAVVNIDLSGTTET